MKIFLPVIEIGENEGFSAEKDIFGRKELGIGLENLLSSISHPLTIAIDGQWGSGKSTFLRMWAGHLRSAGFPVILFDAFENDYTNDPFTAIASEIISLLEDKREQSGGAVRRFTERAVGVGKVLLRGGLKVGVKIGTAGVLDAEGLHAIAGDISGEASNLADKHLGEKLTRQKDDRASIAAFRSALSELPSVLSEEKDRPLVFIIDELDRCRPSFALETLERIKHFFNAEGVHFVLGVHVGQLANSVKTVYGTGINSDLYLQKFIHLNYSLTSYPRHPMERTANKYIADLVRRHEFRQEDRDVVSAVVQMVAFVSHHKDLSLRSIERIIGGLALSLAYSAERMFRPGAIIGGLCIIRVTNPVLYYRAKSGYLSYEEIEEELGFRSIKTTQGDSINWEWISLWWKFAAGATISQEDEEKFSSATFGYSISSREDIVPLIANQIVDRLIPVQ